MTNFQMHSLIQKFERMTLKIIANSQLLGEGLGEELVREAVYRLCIHTR